MSITGPILEEAFARLLERVRGDAALGAEFLESQSEFFAHGATFATPGEAVLAERRHSEWFLLERPCTQLQDVPILAFFEELSSSGTAHQDALQALLGSFSGVFEVTGVTAGEGVWVRDLAGHGEYPLQEAEGSFALEQGDVLVGRLFPVGDTLCRISHAAGIYRSPKLLEALRHDLAQAQSSRRGVLRFSQVELEAMFFVPQPALVAQVPLATPQPPLPLAAGEPQVIPEVFDVPVRPEAIVAQARGLLRSAGLAEVEIDETLEELASEAFDPTPGLVGGEEHLVRILDRLAFDTSVDLELARQALILAWPSLTATVQPPAAKPSSSNGVVAPRKQRAEPALPPSSPSSPSLSNGEETVRDVRAAMAAFDRGRSEGKDLEQLFRQLEAELELDSEEATDDDSAPDFPGVVPAMVEEFLWEIERERGPEEARRLDRVRSFGRFGERIGVFENLGARDLLLYSALWLPEQGGLSSPEEATETLAALREFCLWAEERHEVALGRALEPLLPGLMESLPRITQANRLLGSRLRESPEKAGESALLEYVAPRPGGRSAARDTKGREHEVRVQPEIARLLQPGDRLRSQRDGQGSWQAVCFYPPETGQLGLRA
jgi:hypothetical protein